MSLFCDTGVLCLPSESIRSKIFFPVTAYRVSHSFADINDISYMLTPPIQIAKGISRDSQRVYQSLGFPNTSLDLDTFFSILESPGSWELATIGSAAWRSACSSVAVSHSDVSDILKTGAQKAYIWCGCSSINIPLCIKAQLDGYSIHSFDFSRACLAGCLCQLWWHLCEKDVKADGWKLIVPHLRSGPSQEASDSGPKAAEFDLRFGCSILCQ